MDRERATKAVRDGLITILGTGSWYEAHLLFGQVIDPLLAEAWDEGRRGLQEELRRSWSIYDTSEPTPNPYGAGRRPRRTGDDQ
jgi:hypothetical protein